MCSDIYQKQNTRAKNITILHHILAGTLIYGHQLYQSHTKRNPMRNKRINCTWYRMMWKYTAAMQSRETQRRAASLVVTKKSLRKKPQNHRKAVRIKFRAHRTAYERLCDCSYVVSDYMGFSYLCDIY